jgi:hypothetical protein
LEGVIAAERYAVTVRKSVGPALLPVRREAKSASERISEVLCGERFDVLEERDGFAFGQATRDGYVGWVEADYLAPLGDPPTHRVVALRTPTFVAADIKSPLIHMLSMNALVTPWHTQGPLVEVRGIGWMPASHLAPIGEGFTIDPASIAERFLGVPYLWGGRSSLGLDCSGLIQQALYACGRACPRDSDMQQALGAPLDVRADLNGLMRNDLVFWKGHVGIMLDSDHLLHANAHHMATAPEPLAGAVSRIEAAGGGRPAAFRRL